MSAQFKVDEIAIIQNQVGEASFLNGMECVITGGYALYNWIRTGTNIRGASFGYQVSIPGHFGGLILRPYELRKKKPPTTGERSILDLFLPIKQPDLVEA